MHCILQHRASHITAYRILIATSNNSQCETPSSMHSPGTSGHSSGEIHLPSCTTVPFTQLQPGSQIAGHGGFGSAHVPSQPLHSEYSWPSMSHTA